MLKGLFVVVLIAVVFFLCLWFVFQSHLNGFQFQKRKVYFKTVPLNLEREND